MNSSKGVIPQQSSTTSSSVNKSKKFYPKPLEQLMIHHSDTTVKPIIGNKDIEISEESTFNKSCLPFDSLTAEEFS